MDFYRNLRIEGRYAKAVGPLRNMDLEALEPGRYEINDKNVYADVTAYITIPWEKAKYETHGHYTDIQYVIERSKIMSYVSVHEMIVEVPYNPDEDVVSFESTTPGLQVVTSVERYLIFSLWDAHKPKATNGESAPIKKVIVKTKEDQNAS